MNKISSFMPYDFMVKYTPQEAWIKGRGVFLWLAFFFTEIGAGIYFISLFINLRMGWLLGWLLALVVGGGLHLLYLGRPMRGLLILLKPTTSEMSRGLWATLFFAIVGFFQIIPIIVPGIPWTGDSSILKVIMGIICILVITHGFLTMSIMRALPVWNSAMMVPLSVTSGIWVGGQLVLLISYIYGHDLGSAESWVRWSLFCFIVFFAVFLMGAVQASTTARKSILNLLNGEWSAPFYIGVVGIGIIIPVVITLIIWGNDMNSVNLWFLALRCLCVAIGDLTMRYGLMKNAYYSPII